jgi:hypothetical protein
MDNKVLLVFGILGFGALALAGLEFYSTGHLPPIQLALGGGLIVLTVGGLSD